MRAFLCWMHWHRPAIHQWSGRVYHHFKCGSCGYEWDRWFDELI